MDEGFEAHLTAQFSNPSQNDLSYTLHLFSDGKLVLKKQGIIPAQAKASDELRYTVEI